MRYGFTSRGIEEDIATPYSQESSSAPVVHAKFFTPDAGWTWLITEGSAKGGGDWLLFGYVIGPEEEWGYFLLSEIAGVRGPLRLPVERDLWFQPGPIDEVLRRERQQLLPPAVTDGKGARDER
jgi:Protein of unknown function (DUF2958)